MKSRIKDLSQKKEVGFIGWEFEGGKVEANTDANRLQILFTEKPDEATRAELKSNGFRWSPKAESWQRQLTDNAYYAANYVKAIQPLTGEKPTELLREHITEQQAQPQEQTTPETIYKMHTNPGSDSIETRSFLQAYPGAAQSGKGGTKATQARKEQITGFRKELTHEQVKQV